MKDLPRRGLGLHFVLAEVRFTKDSRKSKLWRSYVPDKKEEDNGDAVAICDDEDLMRVELPEEDLLWCGSNRRNHGSEILPICVRE